MKHKTTNNKIPGDEKTAHQKWCTAFYELQGLVTKEQQDRFWMNVGVDLADLLQLVRQFKLDEHYRRHDQLARLTCKTCAAWEAHLDQWPHNVKVKPDELPDDLLFTQPRRNPPGTLH